MLIKQKRTEQISKHLGLSNSTMHIILSRAEFTKNRYGNVFKINKEFLNNLSEYLEKKTIGRYKEKYANAQIKLYQWSKEINE